MNIWNITSVASFQRGQTPVSCLTGLILFQIQKVGLNAKVGLFPSQSFEEHLERRRYWMQPSSVTELHKIGSDEQIALDNAYSGHSRLLFVTMGQAGMKNNIKGGFFSLEQS